MCALFGTTLIGFFSALQITFWLHLPSALAAPLALVIPALTVALYAVAVRVVESRAPCELSLRGGLTKFGLGYAIGTIWISAMLTLLWALGLYQVSPSHWSSGLNDFIFSSWVSALLEELAFRGILLRLLASLIGPVAALLISSVLFGLAHLGHATWLAGFEIALNGGLVMGLLYLLTGSLWTSIGMHLAWDFTETSILGVNNQSGLLLSVPTRGMPDALTGGAFGPDGSALATLFGLILIAGLLRWQRILPALPAPA